MINYVVFHDLYCFVLWIFPFLLIAFHKHPYGRQGPRAKNADIIVLWSEVDRRSIGESAYAAILVTPLVSTIYVWLGRRPKEQ